MKSIKVLSLPSYHPFISKFNDHKNIEFINPHCDFFVDSQHQSLIALDKCFPLESYDIVHIHFEYYLWKKSQLKSLLMYFKKNNKPIVWTWHDQGSLLTRHSDQSCEELLFKSADIIITLSQGMKEWILENFGNHTREIEVIPSGYISSPKMVKKIAKKVKKRRNLFTMLVGDFRDSKEFLQSIVNFLDSSDLQSANLQVVFRPFSLYKNDFTTINERLLYFHQLINHPRIKIVSKPIFTDEEITRAFYESHAVILPHLWGTHSGQVELAKDCGCHVVASDIGFYKQQWDRITTYSLKPIDNIPISFTSALIKVYTTPSIAPSGDFRDREFKYILNRHLHIYRSVLA